MDLGSVIALGGAGAGAQVAIRLLGMVAAALARSQQAAKEERQEELKGWDAVRKSASNLPNLGGPWIYRMFAVACVFIVLSPLAVPMLTDTCIHFFVPKEPGFFGWFSFDKARLTEYIIPEHPAATARHVALFPFMYSFASNVAWFYIAGRPMKHKFLQ